LTGAYIIVGLFAVDGEANGLKGLNHFEYNRVMNDDVVAIYPPPVSIGSHL
jgi:hypothetical protein